jgi:flagellar protein FlaG
MGIEIPRVRVPTGLHPNLKAGDSAHNPKQGAPVSQTVKSRELPVSIDIREAVKNLEKMVAQFNRRFDISVNESINRIVVKVIDTETDKVVREIPPEEIQHLLARLYDMMGMFINERI